MDAVALGNLNLFLIVPKSSLLILKYFFCDQGEYEGGWSSANKVIAEKYTKGGYPEMADFILA